MHCHFLWYELAFPTGRDSETFRDNGTEVPSLSRDKGTMGQAQNLNAEQAEPGFWDPVTGRAGMGRDGILTACPVPSLYIPGQPLERPRNKRKKNTEFVPGLLHLHWDNGTAGQAKLFFPRQMYSGTGKLFYPGTKGQREVTSQFVPGRPIPWKP